MTTSLSHPNTNQVAAVARPWRRRTGAGLAVGLVAGLLAVVPMAGPASAASGSATYGFIGAPQTFTVPAHVSSLHIEATGGAGHGGPNSIGGRGATVVADLPVGLGTDIVSGDALVVVVGGDGGVGYPGGNGGYNGGGGTFSICSSGGGGGASDVRLATGGLEDRVLVAGGGGGGGWGGDGGHAGQAGQGSEGGQPGSADAGGAGFGFYADSHGSFGQGGEGGRPEYTDYGQIPDSGGAGGGGWYGGGGGNGTLPDMSGCLGDGGGGGSSYIRPSAWDVMVTSPSYAEPHVTITWTEDLNAPVLEERDGVTAEATSPDGAVVTYVAPGASDDQVGPVAVTCDSPSGSTFPIGTTTVTCTATDRAGNAATSDFSVMVVDTAAPVLAVHDDVTVTAEPGANDAVVTYAAPSASDVVDGPVGAHCAPAAGSRFTIGTTSVTCAATDSHGNVGTSSFTVTVNRAAPVEDKADVRVAITGPTTAPVGSKITYTLTVTNRGPAAAVDLASVLWTSGLSGTTASPGGSTGTVKIGGVSVTGTTWRVASLGAGESVTFTVNGKVATQRGKYVTAGGGAISSIEDPNLLNNIAAWSTRTI